MGPRPCARQGCRWPVLVFGFDDGGLLPAVLPLAYGKPEERPTSRQSGECQGDRFSALQTLQSRRAFGRSREYHAGRQGLPHHRDERGGAFAGGPGRGSRLEPRLLSPRLQDRHRADAEELCRRVMSPPQYPAGGANEDIRFAVGQISLGAILVASSKKGVAAILLGDDAEELVHDLQDRFPKASLIGADQDYEAMVARVVGFVEAPEIGLDLPLDIRGTAFQQRVWQALQEIPVGATVCYAELAQRIGAPKAVRAVAGACAANKLAVAIPCHRVIRNDGSTSGYAWGVERKRALLDREASRAN